MTKQITIKLNHALFRPLLDEMRLFAGIGVAETDSDMVAKTLFFCYNFLSRKQKGNHGKTSLDLLLDAKGIEKSDAIVQFLNEYGFFKKVGLQEFKKTKDIVTKGDLK
ncbi:hypothetical protein ACFL3V_07030 [Nanoarchaeota archaeon]